MKYADKRNFDYTIVIGDSELEKNSAELKSMKGGETRKVPLDENIVNAVYEATRENMIMELEDAVEDGMKTGKE